jgi:hypothetical protein
MTADAGSGFLEPSKNYDGSIPIRWLVAREHGTATATAGSRVAIFAIAFL